MIRSLLLITLALGIIAVPRASAEIFTFNQDFCSNPCLGGVPSSNNGGTVEVTQFATNIVDVLVTLNNLYFHDQGLESFAFNITGNPALTLVTTTLVNNSLQIINGGGSTWTLNQPAGNTDGAGSTFGYSLDCAAAPSACAGHPSILEFQVEVTGLTPTSFETLAGSGGTTTNVDFAANVSAGGGACTGMIGAGNGTAQSTPLTTHTGGTPCTSSSVPEPYSVLLLGTALALVGKVLKGRLALA